ncbi:MAG: 50S ribosomal protein L5 [Candidatus Tectomicrobia bacterium]|nr:50S ribosomal protein L5 [Candidatus Tectomicrobia bacterium]
MSRLQDRFKEFVVPELLKEFDYHNIMEVPRLEKIVLNMGLGEAIQNSKLLDSGVSQLADITGQKPIITRARKSIASFKLRTGMAIGCKVTLRRDRMYEFFDRLVNIALPRVRDFRGVSPRGFDGRGNFTLGVKEQIIFPEIEYDKIEKIKGLGIVIVTSARTDEEAKTLLRLLGMPFSQN